MTDEHYMRHALELARNGRYTVSPNPMVGCVIVRDDTVVAEGWHRRAGDAHAEIDALQRCEAHGATLYVTLEPCFHRGRTGPCAEAVIAAGVRRVVIATLDPHEIVDGRGAAAIREAGIEVTVGVLEAEARRLNERFLWSITQKLPFVLVKAGMTLDGKLATVTRDSQWITAEASREASLLLREEYDAILVGSGTVKSDNPRITRRMGLSGGITGWTRVVLDGEGEIPPHAHVLTDGGATLLFTSRPDRYGPAPGLEIVKAGERVDFAQLFSELYARGIHSLIIEGGAVVHSEVIRRGLWQKMILFIAPLVVGGAEAPSIFGGEGVSRLKDAYRFRFDHVEFAGRDLMVVAYPVSATAEHES